MTCSSTRTAKRNTSAMSGRCLRYSTRRGSRPDQTRRSSSSGPSSAWGSWTPEGLRPLADRVDRIKTLDPEHTVKGIQSFLGIINYYKGFVPNTSHVAIGKKWSPYIFVDSRGLQLNILNICIFSVAATISGSRCNAEQQILNTFDC